MAFAHTTRAAHAGIAERIALFAKGWQDARRRRALCNQTRRELSQLSDRDLADMGINRGMIDAIAAEAAYGK
jgi:uncharacterized protein YjiS (DUF1127 family)